MASSPFVDLNPKSSQEIPFFAFDSIMPSPSRRMETIFKSSLPATEPTSIGTLVMEITGQPTDLVINSNRVTELATEKLTLKVSTPSLPVTEQFIGTLAMETNEQPAISLPRQGVWASPPKPIPPSDIPILLYNSNTLSSDIDTQWPSLAARNQIHSRRTPKALSTLTPPSAATVKVSDTSTVLDPDLLQSQEFSWAAKMNPLMRNLHRVTTPVFLEDGTPKIRVPSQVLLEGLENQKEFIIVQFYRCAAPTVGKIHAVMSRIWGTRCRIFTRKVGEFLYLFHIPDESTRNWILQRGLWHVDDCLLFVSAWNPVGTISLPEITTIPVWLTLRNIPNQLYSTKKK